MKTIRTISILLLLTVCTLGSAHDFTVTVEGQKLYFKIRSEKNKTVALTYNGSIADAKPTDYSGELTVPEKVRHNDVIYTVTSISDKAFSGAEQLSGIILPSGLKSIGDFAFEGCTSLEKIIFPGGEIKLGEGVFFKCDKIKKIVFGSDWKKLDLKMFRWSDSLTVVTIPAKIESIQNLKSLRHLESVKVDDNNARFSSFDGMLFNKEATTLYACPRARKGCVMVPQGTLNIFKGAFVDCPEITQIDFPESLESLSYREFSRIKGLEEIIFRSETPVLTAYCETGNIFLLQVANRNIKIIVSKKALKTYRSALHQTEGEYFEIDGQIPYEVRKDDMPVSSNIIAVKSFKQYE